MGDAHVACLEEYCPAVREPPLDQILYHFLLAVDGHTLADELAEIDVVQGAAEREVVLVVEHAFALHADADAGFDEEVAGPLLDQPGANAALDVVAGAVLQDHALDARAVEEMREHQPGGPSTDDTDLRAHLASDYPSAAARSAMRSAASTQTTESRTQLSPIPSSARTPPGTETRDIH